MLSPTDYANYALFNFVFGLSFSVFRYIITFLRK